MVRKLPDTENNVKNQLYRDFERNCFSCMIV